VKRLRFLLPLLLLGLPVSGCGGGLTRSASPASGYQPPPRQHPVLQESLNIHGCSSTTMGGGLVSLCDPTLLQRAWEKHTLNQRGDLDVRIAGRKVRVASTPGLTQAACRFRARRKLPLTAAWPTRESDLGPDITVSQYRAGGVPTNFHDQVPDNPHPVAGVESPEVRQSDGKIVIPG
jgi:hypothetical protein